jgi:hypothetical protein
LVSLVVLTLPTFFPLLVLLHLQARLQATQGKFSVTGYRYRFLFLYFVLFCVFSHTKNFRVVSHIPTFLINLLSTFTSPPTTTPFTSPPTRTPITSPPTRTPKASSSKMTRNYFKTEKGDEYVDIDIKRSENNNGFSCWMEKATKVDGWKKKVDVPVIF